MGILVDGITDWILAHPGLVFGAILFYIFVFLLSLMFSGPKPGPNPFKKDTSRPPSPLVMEQARRDKVIKQAFHTKRLPERLDAIVIGSGIGGLTTAALLSRAGKRVLVLEQHDQAGGCCHTFEEKGFEFDVGIHYIGEMRNNTVSRLLVNQLTDGQLQWVDLIDEFDMVALGETGKKRYYPFHAGGREVWKASMLKSFPDEEKALDKFLDLLQASRKTMLGQIGLKAMSKWAARLLIMTGLVHRFTDYFKYARRTLQEVLDELTDNMDLKAVLSYSFGDYGALPNEASFTTHATLINHYLYGASYPRGGASEIAFHIIPVIEKSGGKVLVRAPVRQILTNDKGRANGVRVGKGSGAVDIFAPLIVSDAGAINTFKRLLPPEIAQRSSINRLIKKKQIQSGVAGVSVFIGLNGTAEELGLIGQNIWSFTGNDYCQIVDDYLKLSAEEAAETESPLLFVSFPSAKDPTYNDRFPGKTVCTVVTFSNWQWFQQWKDEQVNKRGQDYDAIKNGIGRRVWSQVVSLFPQLEDKLEYLEVGSPATNNYYIGSSKGEIYGLDHNVKRFGNPDVIVTMRPETDIPGLLLTGQDVLSGGFMGAMFGGLLSASRALHRNLWNDLVALKKRNDKNK